MVDIHEDWRNTEAGRELDRLIAERLGWKRIETRSIFYEGHDEEDDWAGFRDILVGDSPTGFSDDEVPSYSTDTDAALTLLDPDWTFYLLRAEGGKSWHVNISHHKRDHGVGTAETPALAICRAWLAWKESQTQEQE